MTDLRQPVPRPRVLLGAVVGLLIIAGIAVTADLLRPPVPADAEDPPPLEIIDSDPRDPLACEEFLPREGQQRGDAEGQQPADTPQGEELVGVSAPVVGASQLLDCPEVYDGVTIRYIGEVIGAVLERDDGAWVQLNDDAYASEDGPGPLPGHRDFRGLNVGIGTFISPELAERIRWVGGPDAHGDVLQVTGVFHRVDPLTAEVAIIRADTGTFERRGGPLSEPLQPARRTAALVVAALAIAVTLTERIRARRR